MKIQTRGDSFEKILTIRIKQNQEKVFNANQIIKITIQQYYKEKNWKGMLDYLLLMEQRNMLPLMWKWQVGQAYINNSEFQKSLDYLYIQHFQNPDQPDIQLTILKAFLAIGKSEAGFHWVKRPVTQKIDREVLRNCYLIIALRKNSIPLFILYSMIKKNENLTFDEFDLLFALLKDNRFSILNDTCFYRFSRIDIKAEFLKRAA
ncbi:MAG: hypothetical protein OEV66_10980 [Spirochaetia bacterium]|nr:hypothetical protein [Spirochaetia bacterium]